MEHGIILGIVQGIAEFLPISSSAHLVVIPWMLGWKDYGLAFDVALHLGTFLAIIIYFRADWLKLIKSFFSSIKNRKLSTLDEKLVWFILIGSIPGAVGGLLLESKAEGAFRNPLLVAITLFVFGLIIYWQDRVSKKERKIEKIGWKDAIIIGLAQVIAIVPGVSRSGATIVAGLFQGLKREDAAKFSFLLAAPVMAGAGLLKIHDILNQINLEVILSFLSAFVVGLLAIRLLMGYVRKNSFNIFVFYRIVLALILLSIYLYR